MSALQPIAPIAPGLTPLVTELSSLPKTGSSASFGDLVASGLRTVDAKVAKADALIRAFAEGDAVPVHQVTIALEEARVSVDLAVQVRTRLIETYRDFMNMQL